MIAVALRRLAGMALAAMVLTAPPARAETIAYAMKPGDTLYELGRNFLSSPGDYRIVQRENRIGDPARVRAGRVLKIRAELLRTLPLSAEVVSARGTVWIERAGQRGLARIGARLGEGDRLTTAAASFVTLEMSDESRISLPPSSVLRIEALHEIVLTNALRRRFILESGRSNIVVTPEPSRDSVFEVRTPVSVAAVRGTQFRLANLSGARSGLEVLEGRVGVSAAGPELVVPQDFGAVASPNGLSSLRALLPPPAVPGGAMRQEAPQIVFRVEPLQGARAYRLQIARDAGFVDVVAEAEGEGLDFAFGSLEDGYYFVRASGVDADGLEGRVGAYGFERDLNAVGGAAGETAAGTKGPPRLRFRWSAGGAGMKSYRLQIARTADFSVPLVDVPGLTDNEATISKPPPGAYFWRVIVTRMKNGAIQQKVGEAQSVVVGA